MDPLEPDDFRSPESQVDRLPHRERLPSHRNGELFLKGPVPISWLSRAARLPGKALHVAVALWCEAGIKRHREVKLTRKFLNLFGVTRFASRRGLQQIEADGLVKVERKPGRCPRVTIQDVEDKEAES